MPLEKLSDRVVIKTSKGSSVEVLYYGAHVLSWKTPDGVDHLFVSGKAALDGSAPVRGGIPIVFPAFAYPSHPEHLKQGIHGFARNEQWKLDSVVMDNEAGVSVRFMLQPTPAIKAVWTKDFELAYVITLAEKQLTTDLIAKNTSATESFEFQSALHTYIRAPSKDVRIAPLTGLNVINKVKGVTEVETRELVDVTQWTDSIYENVPDHIEIIWPAGGVQMRKSGFKTLVVWNPQAEAGPKIVDMNEGGWDHFVCVEPSNAREFLMLKPGETWTGQQVLTLL